MATGIAYLRIAYTYFGYAEYRKSLNLGLKGYQYLKQTESSSNIGAILVAIGKSYIELADFTAAKLYLMEAKLIYLKIMAPDNDL